MTSHSNRLMQCTRAGTVVMVSQPVIFCVHAQAAMKLLCSATLLALLLAASSAEASASASSGPRRMLQQPGSIHQIDPWDLGITWELLSLFAEAAAGGRAAQ